MKVVICAAVGFTSRLARGGHARIVVTGEPEAAGRVLYAAFQGTVLASRLFGTKARLDEVGLVYKRR